MVYSVAIHPELVRVSSHFSVYTLLKLLTHSTTVNAVENIVKL